MNGFGKGMALAVLHVGLVASLGGKLLYDRATLPRVWAKAAPYDPELPIRGRYVSLQLAVQEKGIAEPAPNEKWRRQAVELKVENGMLVAVPKPESPRNDGSAPQLRFIERQGEHVAVLDQPVPFFIPEHIPDPSRRQRDEELWVEVTIPKKGPPRPIRLGVKKGAGPIVPIITG